MFVPVDGKTHDQLNRLPGARGAGPLPPPRTPRRLLLADRPAPGGGSDCMSDLDSLLEAVVAEPLAEDRWSVLADWLEENDDPRRAELLRLHRRLLATCCEPDAHPGRAGWQARVVELLGDGVRPCVPQPRFFGSGSSTSS